jgi:hypothetical protein
MGKGKMMCCLRRSNGRSNANYDSPSNVLRSAITESSTTEYSPHHCVGTRTMLDKIHCIHQSYLPYIRHLNTTFLGIHARLKTVLHHFPYRYTNNPLPLFKHRRGRSAALSPSYFPSPLPLPFPFSPSPSPPPTLSITHTPSPPPLSNHAQRPVLPVLGGLNFPHVLEDFGVRDALREEVVELVHFEGGEEGGHFLAIDHYGGNWISKICDNSLLLHDCATYSVQCTMVS